MEEDEDDNSKGEEEDMRDPPNLKSQTTLCPNHKWAEVKKKDKGEMLSELEGRLISDSDIQARKEILLLEAQRNLEVGKKVGIVFIGNEQTVKEELIVLAEKEQQDKNI
ncbi:hypothetical protein V6N12_058330 [Hibiscus sabdariffa]|uniref:Uncharacterized protein n=1 Tax=Hibiscus sabdariffa TaxID=183260 RepID=A0ABR2ERT3_9ROSI